MVTHKTELENSFKYLSDLYVASESDCTRQLEKTARLSQADRDQITNIAKALITDIRTGDARPSAVDQLLMEYELSNDEGVALMRLSEALIRTPDFETARLLIRDKIHDKSWSDHIGIKRSPIVNAASLGLLLSKLWVSASGGEIATNPIAKIGDRVKATAVKQAMSLIGDHFVLGETIEDGMTKGKKWVNKGYRFSFDMLGEAALTQSDAEIYFEKYVKAAEAVALSSKSNNTQNNISIKLSALHPRYEFNNIAECMPALVEKLQHISEIARKGEFSITIDAEEVDRLEASLLIFEQLMLADTGQNWNGMGIVVQAYQKRAPAVLDRLIQLAKQTNKQIPIRLVKGAYWDTEIKRAQEMGLPDYPVFTQKHHTDLSYISCARQLLDAGECVFPKFATHNAHSAAAILHMAGNSRAFEFQRLHGMGEALHDILVQNHSAQCRIYAPIGRHKELLPYLVRRLLENGANSSFVNQLMDSTLDIDSLVVDPISLTEQSANSSHRPIKAPRDHLTEGRLAASGLDWTQSDISTSLEEMAVSQSQIHASCLVDGEAQGGAATDIRNPNNNTDIVGTAKVCNEALVDQAVGSAAKSSWISSSTPDQRAHILEQAADMLESGQDRFIHLCVAEAGKSLPDAIAEIREAVDFLRYYAIEARKSPTTRGPLGVVACISPWNFPLAIFLGQVSASLSAGNSVVAKPAEQTPLIAFAAIELLHSAGVPKDALQLLIGPGHTIGDSLIRHPQISGVCFTGSTATAKKIQSALHSTGRASTPLIAETGGINAMVVDSTALLEQAVTDVVSSAFQSAGQRCSATRLVCVQSDIADDFKKMLRGAIDMLRLGDSRYLSTDVGPVIDQQSFDTITSYIEQQKTNWNIVAQKKLTSSAPNGFFIPPTVFEIDSIDQMKREIFGPVLHLCQFDAKKIDTVVRDINKLGYGLTMGLHTRLDSRIEVVRKSAKVGNLYINRNQIGAVVGVQPFGGEGLSGTGPKAGGPLYLPRLTRERSERNSNLQWSSPANSDPSQTSLPFAAQLEDSISAQKKWETEFDVSQRISMANSFWPASKLTINDATNAVYPDGLTLPGPTGEDNRYYLYPRGVLLALFDDDTDPAVLSKALAAGNTIIAAYAKDGLGALNQYVQNAARSTLPSGCIQLCPLSHITALENIPSEISGIICDDIDPHISTLIEMNSTILPQLTSSDSFHRFFVERVVSIDMTAAGGNAELLSSGQA